MHIEFASMARQELEEALSKLPSNPDDKFLIFTEAVRIMDYWTVFQSVLPKEKRLSVPDFDLIQWGWNLAAENLFTALKVPKGIPLSKSTEDSRLSATNLLLKLGRSVLLYRASEMIRYGLLSAECGNDGYIVKRSTQVFDQFLDLLEFDKMEKRLSNDSEIESNGWKLMDIEDFENLPSKPGAFIGKTQEDRHFEEYRVANIDELMAPLVYPWDSGHGIMLGYDALPEIDEHFFAQAIELAMKWRDEAGIHPNTKFDKINGAELTVIISLIVSLHIKHIRFALLAMEKYSEISIPQSLTIWESKEELVSIIAEYTHFDFDLIRCALDSITMNPDEARHLQKFTTPFVPLLINLGNGLVLRPISSLLRNPFLSIITLNEWRDTVAKDRISKNREEWMRSEIYALFQGTRYSRIDGNIKIRDGSKILTDIDGAVFDTLTGELALFQFKWQDFFTNDVRKLRSKASNLTREIDEWANHVTSWIDHYGHDELMRSLRLKPKGHQDISSIYLFGISRNAARMHGFGFSIKNKNIAIANWPQFVRARCELGPVNRVFNELYNTLREQMNETITAQPLSLNLIVSGRKICFEDLWCAVLK